MQAVTFLSSVLPPVLWVAQPKKRPQRGASWGRSLEVPREETGTISDVVSQSAETIKFSFRNPRVACFESASGLVWVSVGHRTDKGRAEQLGSEITDPSLAVIGDWEFGSALARYRGAALLPDSRNRPVCLRCQRSMTLELQPGGKSPRTFQCLDCDRHDPLKSDALRWLSGELGRTD